MRRLFFSSSDPARPRAGWRLIVFVGVWMLAMLLLMLPAGVADYATGGAMFDRDTPTESQHLAFALVGMAAALIASRLSARFVDRRPIAHYGLSFDRVWWRDYGFGLFIGALQMVFVFGVLLGGDWIAVESVRFTSAVAISLALSFLLHFAVGFGEELFTRGAPLVMLEEGFRWRRVPPIAASMIALLITSTVFGLMHAGNPNASSISNINLIVAGIALAIPVLLTRQLAISMGAHTTWNFVQGAVLGFPVSGQDLATPLIDSEPTGPLYLTGGAFGPEAGVLTIISEVLFVAAVIVYVKRTRGAARILPPPQRIVPMPPPQQSAMPIETAASPLDEQVSSEIAPSDFEPATDERPPAETASEERPDRPASTD